jgi:hypothetical protein
MSFYVKLGKLFRTGLAVLSAYRWLRGKPACRRETAAQCFGKDSVFPQWKSLEAVSRKRKLRFRF